MRRSRRNPACAEENYRWLLQKKPEDVSLRANLAFALTRQDKHAEAISYYDKLIAEGEGTYDIFAHYADSLKAVGRDDDAITWNYRALAIVPKLVDVRGDLAKILVKKNRPYEALALLASFDEHLEMKGREPYFKGQRLAIAAALPEASSQKIPVKIAKIDGHYYTVVIDKNKEPLPFMVDTGASITTLSFKVLESLGIAIPKNAKMLELQLADQRRVSGQEFVIEKLQVGGEFLKNIRVIVCETCASLLGQSTLERYDLATSRANGLEFLTMTPRG